MNTIKAIATKYWQLKTDKLTALALLFVAPSLIYIALRFVTAMGWRLVGNTPYYQAGFVISALCILTLVISLITITIVGNNSFKRKGKRSDLFQGLVFGLTCFLFCILITSTPPVKKLVNQMLGNIYYLEAVTDESFVKLKDTIENSLLPPRKVLISSGGGSGFAGLAIGRLIHENNLDVHIVGTCSSSCANFLFPSGRKKVFYSNAIVMYHGNGLQKNLINVKNELDNVKGDVSKLPKDLDLGRKGKEGSISFTNTPVSDARKEIYSYLGWPPNLPILELFKLRDQEEEAFYQQLGIDHKIGIYGQEGDHLETYQKGEYDGFYYSIEDMKKMGIKNIRVKGKKWQPQLNPDHSRFYKIDLPDDYQKPTPNKKSL